MSYATQSDLVERFGADELAQLTNRVDATSIDALVLGRALADADAEIDGYLATRYQLPLASTAPMLVRLGADITRYRLYDDGVPATVRQRYEDAVSLLKRLSNGEVQLAGASAVAVIGGAGNAVAIKTPTRLFGPAQLQGY